jgi:hypothetical protein
VDSTVLVGLYCFSQAWSLPDSFSRFCPSVRSAHAALGRECGLSLSPCRPCLPFPSRRRARGCPSQPVLFEPNMPVFVQPQLSNPNPRRLLLAYRPYLSCKPGFCSSFIRRALGIVAVFAYSFNDSHTFTAQPKATAHTMIMMLRKMRGTV